jgi:integral membrane sensor domain MASE1
MAEYRSESVPDLVRGLLSDTRDLIREEIALARTEISEEISAAQTVGVAFGAATVAALVGVVVLSVAIGGAIAYVLGWPTWAGYGMVAILLLGSAFVLFRYGRGRLAQLRALPKTTATVKENLEWMQNKSNAK